MIMRLVHETAPPDHEKQFGAWGAYPEGWRELSEADFVLESMGRIYSPQYLEYRQFYQPINGVDHATLQFFYDGTGEAIFFDYWAKKMRYFRFGCKHDYKEIERPAGHRSGIHKDKCSKCGFVNGYDTSD